MPLSALLSVAGALYGHHVVGHLAGVLHLAQARLSMALPLSCLGNAALHRAVHNSQRLSKRSQPVSRP